MFYDAKRIKGNDRWGRGVGGISVAIIKTKSATIVSFLLLALSFSPFLFLRYYDFGASRAQETCLLTLFQANDCKFR